MNAAQPWPNPLQLFPVFLLAQLGIGLPVQLQRRMIHTIHQVDCRIGAIGQRTAMVFKRHLQPRFPRDLTTLPCFPDRLFHLGFTDLSGRSSAGPDPNQRRSQRQRSLSWEQNALQAVLARKQAQAQMFFHRLNLAFDGQKARMFAYYRRVRALRAEAAARAAAALNSEGTNRNDNNDADD